MTNNPSKNKATTNRNTTDENANAENRNETSQGKTDQTKQPEPDKEIVLSDSDDDDDEALTGNFFNNAWLDQTSKKTYTNDTFRVATSTLFKDYNIDRAKMRKVVLIGRLMQACTPTQAKELYNYNVNIKVQNKNDPSRKSLVPSSMYQKYQYLLIFADLFNPPHSFCIIMHTKSQLQQMFHSATAAEQVTVGEVVAVVTPSLTGNFLGKEMPIIESPTILLKLKRNAIQWFTYDIQASTDRIPQLFFYETSKKINVTATKILTGGQITCANRLCDQQRDKCTGCYGHPRTIKPIVLESQIYVEDAPKYDLPTGAAFSLRSTRWSTYFFRDLSKFSEKDDDTIAEVQATYLNEHIDKMVGFVNNHGGWKIAGWHKRGYLAEDKTVMTNNEGHLSFLEPNNLDVLNHKEYRNWLLPKKQQKRRLIDLTT